ncbi:hypothetical protein BGW36DRAFT_465093 [Talaromyces proteolyticus]|uniref:C2H2-type domain-containing protein n=1 Tax=Talaromyces proteolyticus TaxID=1131652 RepID=A0AAD4KHH2_9EURO|nr:uncharacterized protein BGW36DRAFT_465093 [Talaromyces proteolyticus]KAH8691322.1 hypothetical protein BGW36DRAFT_465093 [Talaromyces proteolyticus]
MTNYFDEEILFSSDYDPSIADSTIPSSDVHRGHENQLIIPTGPGHIPRHQHVLPRPLTVDQGNLPYGSSAPYYENVWGPQQAPFINPFDVPAENPCLQPNMGAEAPSRSGEAIYFDPLRQTGLEMHNSDGSYTDRNERCKWGDCDLTFTRHEQLELHFKVAHPIPDPDTKVCKWEECRRRLGRFRDLERHVMNVHISPNSQACPTDGCKRTGRKDNIHRHHRKAHRQSL